MGAAAVRLTWSSKPTVGGKLFAFNGYWTDVRYSPNTKGSASAQT